MKYKVLLTIAVVILGVGVAGSIFVLCSPQKDTVQVRQNGKVIRTVFLAGSHDEVFTVSGHGGHNVIEIKGGRIRVKEADCPDKTCVHMGWLSSSAIPIVCLPHHLEICYAESDSGADAVAG